VPALGSRYPDEHGVRAAVVEELREHVLHAATVPRRAETPTVLVIAAQCDGDADTAARRRTDKRDDGLAAKHETLPARRAFLHENSTVGRICQQAHQANNNSSIV